MVLLAMTLLSTGGNLLKTLAETVEYVLRDRPGSGTMTGGGDRAGRDRSGAVEICEFVASGAIDLCIPISELISTHASAPRSVALRCPRIRRAGCEPLP